MGRTIFLQSKVIALLLIVSWAFSTCPAKGQVTAKKTLTEDDYHLWGRLSMGKLSGNGRWLSWKMAYEDGSDTLYVARTSGKSKPILFTGNSTYDFLADDFFVSLGKDSIIRICDLNKGTAWKISRVKQFYNLIENKLLLIEMDGIGGVPEIQIKDYMGKEIFSLKDVSSWSYNHHKGQIAFIIQHNDTSECILLELKGSTLKIITQASGMTMEKPVWDKNGQFIGILCKGSNAERGHLFLYDTGTQMLSTYDAGQDPFFPVNRNIISSGVISLSVAPDGKGLFFGTGLKKKPQLMNSDTVVEVWGASDKVLYPRQKLLNSSRKPYVAYWDRESRKIVQISDSIGPSAGLTGNMRYSITWNNYAYEPQFDRESPVDYYIVDHAKGTKKLWLKKQPQGSVYPIMTSNLILFKAGSWKLYDPEKGTIQIIDIPIDNVLPQQALEKTAPDFNPISDTSGNWLIVHDGYDLWKYNLHTEKKVRLTYGREKELRYILPEKELNTWKNYDLSFIRSFDLSKPLILKMKRTDYSATGYCLLYPDGTLKEIVFDEIGYDNIVSDDANKIFGFTAESFSQPRSVITKCKGNHQTIYESNKHQTKYYWGKANLVRYNVGGKKLQGILYAPENINPTLKYPLIVMVYEKLSDQIYFSRIPSLINGNGFNAANLVAKGYFVFLPDIEYTLGNPGQDALNCINTALDVIIENNPIDEKKIGLAGHSFGGYEVSSMLCNTGKFAAAVVGAGITNALSYYLSPNKNNLRPNYWRYEFAQMRIGKSLYDDKELYLKNSPVFNADKITTPVMIWTGEKDTQVEPEQAFNLYLGLRRLQKECYLLVYPNEEHNLWGTEANEDLTRRTEEWFDHFLKGNAIEWIK